MNIRTRMITLVSALLVAIAIAPQSAIAARPTNPTVLTPPYDGAFSRPLCQQTGTGVCAATATADASTGWVTVSGTATAVYSPFASAQTGTADAQPYGAVLESFNIPHGGASSVTFTVTTDIDYAIAESSGPLNSGARVYLAVYSGVSGSCTSCTVSSEERIADTDPSTLAPASWSEQDHTFTFVLKSASGDRLRGRGYINIYLKSSGYASSEFLTDAFAHVRAAVAFNSVTATFVS